MQIEIETPMTINIPSKVFTVVSIGQNLGKLYIVTLYVCSDTLEGACQKVSDATLGTVIAVFHGVNANLLVGTSVDLKNGYEMIVTRIQEL